MRHHQMSASGSAGVNFLQAGVGGVNVKRHLPASASGSDQRSFHVVPRPRRSARQSEGVEIRPLLLIYEDYRHTISPGMGAAAARKVETPTGRAMSLSALRHPRFAASRLPRLERGSSNVQPPADRAGSAHFDEIQHCLAQRGKDLRDFREGLECGIAWRFRRRQRRDIFQPSRSIDQAHLVAASTFWGPRLRTGRIFPPFTYENRI